MAEKVFFGANERSSLFCRSVSDELKRFIRLKPKRFFEAMTKKILVLSNRFFSVSTQPEKEVNVVTQEE
jgi:hypothetical protein